MKIRFGLLILLVALAACAPPGPEGGHVPPATVQLPIDPEMGDPPAATDAGVTFGRTEEGAFFQGAADAPVTLIDYSDFL